MVSYFQTFQEILTTSLKQKSWSISNIDSETQMTTGETAESLYPSDSTSSTTRSSSLNHSSQHSSQDRNRANSFSIYENTLGAETPPFDTLSMK